ncbi:MAG: hypothetical protein LBI79_00875 [Nitrososphaerota archaeon]|jgi:hypothetical protein|nr:hypothetical protein [Nitrososphaerota archaeon]
MTVIFEDSFESGDFSKWTTVSASAGTSISVSSVWAHQGTKSALFANNNQSPITMYLQKTISAADEVYMRFYIKATALTIDPTGYVHLAGFRSATGFLCQIRLMPQGGNNYLQLDYYAGGTTQKLSSTRFLANTVYCLELHFKRGAGNAEIHVYLNGAEVTDLTVTGLTLNSAVANIQLGSDWACYPGGFSNLIFYDAVIVSNEYVGTSARVINVVPGVPNNLIDAMAACGGGTLILQPGEHVLTQTLNWLPGVSIFGSGRSNTTIKLSAPIAGVGLMASGLYRCSLRSLSLDLAGTAPNGTGLKLLQCQDMVIDDVAFINIPALVTAIQIEGQSDNRAAYATSMNNQLSNVSITNTQNHFGIGIRIIDSARTRLDTIKLRLPRIGIQLECHDTLANGGYSEATSLQNISIEDPSEYGYQHINSRNPKDGQNASFAFTRIEHMDIILDTEGSTGIYIPGPAQNSCTLDRSALDQINIWFHANNTTGIRLGCSADQLSIRNLILESFRSMPNTCTGIQIDDTFSGHIIQWMQAPLFAAATNMGWGANNNRKFVAPVDAYKFLNSKSFGFINQHVKSDGQPALDRWYDNDGVEPFTVQIEGDSGYITAKGIKPIDNTVGIGEVGTVGAPFENLNVKNGSIGNLGVPGTLSVNAIKNMSGGTFIFDWAGGIVTDNITVQRSEAQLRLNATSGYPALVFYRDGTQRLGLLYVAADTIGQSYLSFWDYYGARQVASLNHDGQFGILGDLQIGNRLLVDGSYGSAGQVLTSNGSNKPTWQTLSGSWNGGTITENLTITRTDPQLRLNATSGNPGIFFYDGGVQKMDLNYSSSGDYLYLYDSLGARLIARWDHTGDYGILGKFVAGTNTQYVTLGAASGRAYLEASANMPLDLKPGSNAAVYATGDFYANNLLPRNGGNTGNIGNGSTYWQGIIGNEIYGSLVSPRGGSNTGDIGASGRYWYRIYVNLVYSKNAGNIVGCARIKSGLEWPHRFNDYDTALASLVHQMTKTKYHITYDLTMEDKIICTCGKSTDNPCPEHLSEWNDRYTIELDDVVLGGGYVTMEHAAYIARLTQKNLELENRLTTLEVKLAQLLSAGSEVDT